MNYTKCNMFACLSLLKVVFYSLLYGCFFDSMCNICLLPPSLLGSTLFRYFYYFTEYQSTKTIRVAGVRLLPLLLLLSAFNFRLYLCCC